MTSKLIIQGGCRPRGEVIISGAKNSALPLLMATLLCRGEHTLENIPNVVDVQTTKKLLECLGAKVVLEDHHVSVDTRSVSLTRTPEQIVKQMRASILALGPLLAHCGQAEVAMPGGCAIGDRPVNIHLEGLLALGASIEMDQGYIIAKAKKLKGAPIRLSFPTVTGTENLMMAACLAKGETLLENPAREPEIVDLASALNSMGAKISGAGEKVMRIEGASSLKPLRYYEVMSDRIEVGTFMIAAAATEGDVVLRKVDPQYLSALTLLLRKGGVSVEEDVSSRFVRVRGPRQLRSVNLVTAPYPGFPTDLQAQMMAAMTRGDAVSTIREEIFENRLTQVLEMRRMGAAIEVSNCEARIDGPASRLRGEKVKAADLRASAALVILGMMSEGVTEVSGLEHLDRGYEGIEKKLAALGVNIKRTPPTLST